jgi:hypothetical protein
MMLVLLFFFSCGNPPVKKLLEEKKERNVIPSTPKQVSKKKYFSMDEISEELNEAHSKTDCMIEYLNRKDKKQVDVSYEEYCP